MIEEVKDDFDYFASHMGTYATYLKQGDSPWKRGLIPHNINISHDKLIKISVA